MKILVVDDEAEARAILQTILMDVGLIDFAGDGPEAVELVRKQLELGEPYGLITLDIKMPTMDGDAVLDEIRTMEADHGGRASKVIMLSGLQNIDDALSAFMDDKADAYLGKPIDAGELLRTIRELDIHV